MARSPRGMNDMTSDYVFMDTYDEEHCLQGQRISETVLSNFRTMNTHQGNVISVAGKVEVLRQTFDSSITWNEIIGDQRIRSTELIACHTYVSSIELSAEVK